jgi:hypothetical protein
MGKDSACINSHYLVVRVPVVAPYYAATAILSLSPPQVGSNVSLNLIVIIIVNDNVLGNCIYVLFTVVRWFNFT